MIITHLIGKEEKEVYTRGGSAASRLCTVFIAADTVMRMIRVIQAQVQLISDLETNLYDVKTEKLIWSGKSDSWSRDSKDQIINDVIKAVINDLQNNKLIAPK